MPGLIRARVELLDRYLDPQNPLDIGSYNWQLLAEGDSWFSITDINLLNQNLLERLDFGQRAIVVNAAQSGAIAGAMFTKNDKFKRALQQQWWLGLLISASGNDLIDALQVTPKNPDTGAYRPERERILRTPEETGNSDNPHDYVSDAGFNSLSGYLLFWFATLVQWRDSARSKTRGRPIFIHNYSIPVPRPAGVPGTPDAWLYKALTLYGIPPALHKGIGNIVFGKLRGFLMGLDSDAISGYALQAFHVFDSAAVHLDPATTPQGPSGDWINEIHLTTAGADKLAKAFSAFIENRFSRYPMPAVAP